VGNFTPFPIKKIFANSTTRKYDSGQIVVYQGDKPMHAMFIKSGCVKYYDIDENGDEKIIHILGPKSFIPLFYFFAHGQKEVDSFYSTLTETELELIPANEFIKKLKNDFEFSNMIAMYVVQRIKSLTKNDARQKVIETLNYLVIKHSSSTLRGWNKVNFPLTQQTLANLTNLSRETVNSVIKDLEKEKVVRSPHQAQIEIKKSRLNKTLRA
jgi:CRP/FNR family transcriptional regulator, cyclic AMP receptor protein